MARKKKSVLVAAARARNAKFAKKLEQKPIEISSSSDSEVCHWDGGVNHEPTSDSEFCITDSEMDTSDCEEFSDLDGEDLVDSIEEEMKKKGLPVPLAIIMQSAGQTAVWKKAERNWAMGYNGQSARTKQLHAKKACEKAATDVVLRKSKGADMMRSFVTTPKHPTRCSVNANQAVPGPETHVPQTLSPLPPLPLLDLDEEDIFHGYLSDISELDDLESDTGHTADDEDDEQQPTTVISEQSNSVTDSPAHPANPASEDQFPVRLAPPLKRRKLEVPV
ncbi:hypothetical protein BDN71DRAFT_1504597 [Pleurotus eryngii]|uniref:Uncharacterized protein n=1 Tax=Pleurotus eryngii TaxID=5323 RepID=A0A9P6A3K4_PLEER|nr:hypothetical protein BDN71DRAFT_1504597 [Pleurotus eryngii]